MYPNLNFLNIEFDFLFLSSSYQDGSVLDKVLEDQRER